MIEQQLSENESLDLGEYKIMSHRILVVGSINMDLVIRAPHIPLTGQTLIGEEFLTFPGGKGANQAVAARRLGGEVRMVGKVGKDSFGKALVKNMVSEKVDVSGVASITGVSSGVALIVVDTEGQNTIVVSSGANMSLRPEDLQGFRDYFSWAEVAVFQLESPIETVLEGVKMAKNKGIPVILNPAPARALPPEIWKMIDIFVPNETEAAVLSCGLGSNLGIEETSRGFLTKGVKEVIISLGGKGCYYDSGKESFFLPAFQVHAIDSTAAGDAFVGALAVGLTSGWNTKRRLLFASASGALACTHKGTQSSLPRKEEVESFLKLKEESMHEKNWNFKL